MNIIEIVFPVPIVTETKIKNIPIKHTIILGEWNILLIILLCFSYYHPDNQYLFILKYICYKIVNK